MSGYNIHYPIPFPDPLPDPPKSLALTILLALFVGMPFFLYSCVNTPLSTDVLGPYRPALQLLAFDGTVLALRPHPEFAPLVVDIATAAEAELSQNPASATMVTALILDVLSHSHTSLSQAEQGIVVNLLIGVLDAANAYLIQRGLSAEVQALAIPDILRWVHDGAFSVVALSNPILHN